MFNKNSTDKINVMLSVKTFIHAQKSTKSFEYIFAGAKLMPNQLNVCFIRVFQYNSMCLLSS